MTVSHVVISYACENCQHRKFNPKTQLHPPLTTIKDVQEATD